jgi:hypothetical protein
MFDIINPYDEMTDEEMEDFLRERDESEMNSEPESERGQFDDTIYRQMGNQPIYDQIDREQQRARDLAFGRAAELGREADSAMSIALRDERAVAGEDTEQAAIRAANLAKSQLAGTAGGGAAAIAGMGAAQQARDGEYANLLQRARDRKDIFEQKAVDRRNLAFNILGGASVAEQARLRDQVLRDFIGRMMDDRQEVQRIGAERGRQDLTRGRREAREEQEREAQRLREEREREEAEALPSNFGVDEEGYPLVYYIIRDGRRHYFRRSVDPVSYAENWTNYWNFLMDPSSDATDWQRSTLRFIPEIPPSKFAPVSSTPTTNSDERLKIYDEQGPNTAIAGDAEDMYALAMQEAEDLFEDDGYGLSMAMLDKYGRM